MYVNNIIKELKSLATEERRQINQWFFKTGEGQYSQFDQFIGVRTPQIRQIAKKYFNKVNFAQLDKLINHNVHEVRHCGLIILVNKYQSGNEKSVFNYYVDNIHVANNWDLVDTTIPYIIGHYIVSHQDKLALLFEYSVTDDLWKKRIAIVATLAFIKQKEFVPTFTIAKILLNDKHDLIHKAVGWMLREVYKQNSQVAKLFLLNNYAQLPRTTLRYAIERMDEDERLCYLKNKF